MLIIFTFQVFWVKKHSKLTWKIKIKIKIPILSNISVLLDVICQKQAHFLSAQMALVSTFFQMFIVLAWISRKPFIKSNSFSLQMKILAPPTMWHQNIGSFLSLETHYIWHSIASKHQVDSRFHLFVCQEISLHTLLIISNLFGFVHSSNCYH